LSFILLITLITLYFYIRIRYSAILLNHINIKWNFKLNSLNINISILLFINFFSLLGLIFINYLYLFF
jgi:NADH-ubiquinone oxidoreductase chain 2